METDGLQRMLDFLNILREKKIHFYIEQQDEEGLRVTLTLIGARVEVIFTVEYMMFSVFKGSEGVISDTKVLDDVIKEHWGDE
jgi:hypothetical protein